jgi:hypothetical protein
MAKEVGYFRHHVPPASKKIAQSSAKGEAKSPKGVTPHMRLDLPLDVIPSERVWREGLVTGQSIVPSAACVMKRKVMGPPHAPRKRAYFTPQHWLLCFLGLYEFEFGFGFIWGWARCSPPPKGSDEARGSLGNCFVIILGLCEEEVR